MSVILVTKSTVRAYQLREGYYMHVPGAKEGETYYAVPKNSFDEMVQKIKAAQAVIRAAVKYKNTPSADTEAKMLAEHELLMAVDKALEAYDAMTKNTKDSHKGDVDA